MFGFSAQPPKPRFFKRHDVRRTIILAAVIVLGMVLGYQVLRHPDKPESAPQVLAPDKHSLPGKKQGLPGMEPTTEPLNAKKIPQRQSEIVSGKITKRQDLAAGTDVDQPAAFAESGPETPVSPVWVEDARELVEDLLHIPPEEIKQTLQAIVRLGESAVPAIREFLDSQEYGNLPENYRALQLALLDALNQIGGQEALEILSRRLETTTDPEEIALLAQGVETHAPGVYREDLLNAARKVLALASEDPEQVDNKNLLALSKVFATYGDERVVYDLEALYPQRKTFSMMALAELPGGVGIPSLTQIVEDPETTPNDRNFAWRMLAQASRVSPEASQVLVDMAWSSQIPKDDFIKIASTLGGKEYRFLDSELFANVVRKGTRSGNLPVTHIDLSSPSRWSDAEIDQRVALIDRLLETKPESLVVFELEDARNSLLEWKEIDFIDGVRTKRRFGE